MPQIERDREIKRRRQYKAKMRLLRDKLEKERDGKVRSKLITKIKKMSPLAVVPEK